MEPEENKVIDGNPLSNISGTQGHALMKPIHTRIREINVVTLWVVSADSSGGVRGTAYKVIVPF